MGNEKGYFVTRNRSDHGIEFENTSFMHFYDEHGIVPYLWHLIHLKKQGYRDKESDITRNDKNNA